MSHDGWTTATLGAGAREAMPRHPLCTCPEITFGGPAPDRSRCKGGALAHYVLTEADVTELIKGYRRA